MLTSTKEVRTENTYESNTGYLASTSHNTTNAGGNVVYNFDYDGLGRQTGVSVGSAVLSETSYHPQLGTVVLSGTVLFDTCHHFSVPKLPIEKEWHCRTWIVRKETEHLES